MSRVDFYILSDASPVERFACSVTARALSKGKRVHIHTSDEAAASNMDDLLWTYRDIGFIPHELLDADVDDVTPVTIGHGDNYPGNTDVLVNLDNTIPTFSTRFERIVEIVGGNEENKALARQRYREYRNGDHEIHDHHINTAEMS